MMYIPLERLSNEEFTDVYQAVLSENYRRSRASQSAPVLSMTAYEIDLLEHLGRDIATLEVSERLGVSLEFAAGVVERYAGPMSYYRNVRQFGVLR